jgi:hypothetical protein
MKTESAPHFATITPAFPNSPFRFHPFVRVNKLEEIERQEDRRPAGSRRSGVFNRFSGAFEVRHQKSGRKLFGVLGMVGLWMLLCAPAWAGQSVSLSWNTNAGAAPAGYALYRGTSTGNYTTRIDVGTNTTVTLTGLKEGQTNFFAVAAYNAARVEGAPSPEIVYLVPGLARLTPPKSGNPASISFPAAIGHWYEVQASVNLTTWSTIWQSSSSTSNAWMTFQDPQSATFSKRFYRVVMH